jgi:hypothetical protein
VAEIFRAVRLAHGPRLPGAKAQVERLLESAEQLEQYAQERLQRLKAKWAERDPIFEWLSRYRTVRGIWSDRSYWGKAPGNWSELKAGAHAVAAELSLTPDLLREQIREHLLGLWREWSRDSPSTAARALLQADIAIAIQSLEVLTGQPENPQDEFWSPADRQPRGWARLTDALPFEAHQAQHRLPEQAAAEIDRSDYHALAPPHLKLNESALEKLTAEWWTKSVALRRFALALRRLTDHNFGHVNEQRLVALVEETPVEFLILCALHGERFLHERFAPGAGWSFWKLLQAAAERFATSYGIVDKTAFLDELKEAYHSKARLHDLPQNPGDPFTTAASFRHPEPFARFWLSTLTNFAVMRNYAAHHDCLDDKLFQNYWVAAGLEALIIVMFATLATEPSSVTPPSQTAPTTTT